MLETVERISNISKCRDLINFELLLYRISIFIFWDKKLNLNKKINKNWNVDCRRQNTAKAIFCFIFKPEIKIIENVSVVI